VASQVSCLSDQFGEQIIGTESLSVEEVIPCGPILLFFSDGADRLRHRMAAQRDEHPPRQLAHAFEGAMLPKDVIKM
jgi:hypothetical protein